MSQPLFENLTRADQIEAAWRRFHEANPRVWNLFQQFAFELINKGRTHCSADMILHRIRFEMAGEVITQEPVRINNNHSTYYSDLFMSTYPQHGTFFSKRRRISEDKPACDPDIQVHDGGPRKPNPGLDVRMGELAHQNTKEFHRP